MPNKEITAKDVSVFANIVLGATLLIAVLTPFDEDLCNKLGLYRAGDTMEATPATGDIAKAFMAQEERLNVIADNHNKLVAGVQSDIGYMKAAYRGLHMVMTYVHGTNVWEAARKAAVEKNSPTKEEVHDEDE